MDTSFDSMCELILKLAQSSGQYPSFEEICGNTSDGRMAADNCFYMRFGMSAEEVLAHISKTYA